MGERKQNSIKKRLGWLGVILLLLLLMPGWVGAEDKGSGAKEKSEDFGISQEMGDAMARQAGQVKKQLEKQALSLFKRESLGFTPQSFKRLYNWVIQLPLKIPDLMRQVVEQSRLLGVLGSALMVVFLFVLLYSLLGRQRLIDRITSKVEPLEQRIPKSLYPFILPAIRVVTIALVPLVLLAIHSLVDALVDFEAEWFELTGRLLQLWAVGALVIRFLRELLTHGLLRFSLQHGPSLFKMARLVALYALTGVGLVWAAQAFELHKELLALLRFAMSLSIIMVLFLLFLKKTAILSLLPVLPYRSYRSFQHLLERYYLPVILFSLLAALLWSIGYRKLGAVILFKLWTSGVAYILIMLLYHTLQRTLDRWHARTDVSDEGAALVYQSFKRLIIFCTVAAIVLVIFNLLGLLGPLQQILSFPVFTLGNTHVSLWILIKAALILMIFLFVSRLLQSYFEYKIYPAMGIEPGLGYALNTFLKYLMLVVGVLVSLNIVGLDLRFLLVFAGALGIGLGLGLQNLVANVISGFALIFGGKLRKGDWIEVNGTVGMVTDIYLRATNVRTRDNIEYLIPNNELINGVLINYSLGSPLIRISVPVGVAYSADPRFVEKILLAVAGREPLVSKTNPPMVVFTAYGDNSINFELLVWIDVRACAVRLVRSALYFAIFDELKKAGIEIPFPQRDLHIRGGLDGLSTVLTGQGQAATRSRPRT